MEDQDHETRIEEDVEGHSHYAPNKGAPNKGRNIGKDEGDDVEAHVHLNAPNKGAPNKG
jgi:hypothetical protein